MDMGLLKAVCERGFLAFHTVEGFHTGRVAFLYDRHRVIRAGGQGAGRARRAMHAPAAACVKNTFFGVRFARRLTAGRDPRNDFLKQPV